MSRTSQMERRSLLHTLSVAALVLTCFSLIFALAGRSAQPPRPPQSNTPAVVNKLNSLAFVSIVENDEGYVLRLRNISAKPINGYSIATGPNSKMTIDLTAGERVFAPGDLTDIHVPKAAHQQNLSNKSAPQKLTVLAVVFEDATSEGDLQTVAEIRDRRLGAKQQLARIGLLLEATVSSPVVENASLSDLRSKILALPEDPEPPASPYVKAGLHSAKEDVLLEIQKLERGGGDIRMGLIRMNDQSKKRTGRIQLPLR